MQNLEKQQVLEIFSDFVSRVPTSLAIKHSMRLVPIHKAIGKEGQRILDVGCGDGSFWNAFPGRQQHVVHGIDLSVHEAALALKAGVFNRLEIGDISRWVPEDRYDIAIGNCSMEHVPDIHNALINIRQALKDDGRLLLLVPAFGWTRTMRLVRMMERRSTRLAMATAGAIDGFFQHHHLYDQDTWQFLLQKAGYDVLSCRGIGSPLLNALFERYLPLAFLEFLHKSVFRAYPRTQMLRRSIDTPALEALLAQPVPVETVGVVEYLIEATPSAKRDQA